MTATTPDQRAARIAARRLGIITRPQARACGLTDKQINARVRNGRWQRVYRGVYRIAGAPENPEQAMYAAAVASGPDARVCGLSALSLLGVGSPPQLPCVTVPPSGSGRHEAASVRRSPVPRADRTSVGPIPCTAPARALLEAAREVNKDVLVELVDDVITRGLATPSSVLGAVRRSATGPGRAGSIRLREALIPWLEDIRPGSAAETRLIRRISDWGFPAPRRQHPVAVASGRVALLDLAWPEHLVGLEYDGEAFHTPRTLTADVGREELIRRLGWWIGRADRHDLRPSSTRLRDELGARLTAAAA